MGAEKMGLGQSLADPEIGKTSHCGQSYFAFWKAPVEKYKGWVPRA